MTHSNYSHIYVSGPWGALRIIAHSIKMVKLGCYQSLRHEDMDCQFLRNVESRAQHDTLIIVSKHNHEIFNKFP